MRGFITGKDVLLHPLQVVIPFGIRVYVRCLARLASGHGDATFLECIWESDSKRDGEPRSSSAPSAAQPSRLRWLRARRP
jgi:hypothetical protein